MNRAERRAQQHKKQPSQGGPQPLQQMTIDYAHNGHHVCVMFNARLDNLMLTENQVDGMIEGLTKTKAALIAHKAAAAAQQGHGNA